MPTKIDRRSDSVWCGRIHRYPPIAEPRVIARYGHKSIVMAMGALEQLTAIDLAAMVEAEAQRPKTSMVFLLLGLVGGRFKGVTAARRILNRARKHAVVVAYLQELAYGPTLSLAYSCDLVFASPQCRIGWLECYDEHTQEFDVGKSWRMIGRLAGDNPKVSRQQFARLLRDEVSGELAEASGIVGGLKQSVFDLAQMDPNGADL